MDFNRFWIKKDVDWWYDGGSVNLVKITLVSIEIMSIYKQCWTIIVNEWLW